MSHQPPTSSNSDRPALGARENFWGEDDGYDVEAGHREVAGTTPPKYIARQLLLSLVTPICGRTLSETGEEVDLTDPTFYLPKQKEVSGGYIEYRQHRHRRRVNPETGYINWGESTATDIPEFGHETYLLAVHTYLARRQAKDALRITAVEDYLEEAKRFWHNQQLNSLGSLEKFVAYVRDSEQ